jgi:hypothetical protein
MKRIAAAILLAAIATSAYASCVTHTVFSNGRMVTCQTCCYNGGNCTTICI